jgi:hemerythrin-like domain-containing protein
MAAPEMPVTDYGHAPLFGGFLTPSSRHPERSVALAQICERAGLDLVTFQDHPYQPGFLDTWTLLSYVAAYTSTVRLSPNVLNLPLRAPAVVARSAASLDLLSGGRLELGLGVGAFWDAIEAMGGQRLNPAQAVQALDEAIEVIRGSWRADDRSLLRVDGEFHRVHGAKRGPAPAHDIRIWLGAYKPRMLALTGRKADGWLPSLGYVQPGELATGNAIIDEAAVAAGREPGDIRRMLNIVGEFSASGTGLLQGPPAKWAEDLAGLALRDGISAFILGSDDAAMIERFGEEVAPAARELIGAERRRGTPAPLGTSGDTTVTVRSAGSAAPLESDARPAGSDARPAGSDERPAAITSTQYERLGVTPTPDTGERLSSARLWDENTRPVRPEPPSDVVYTDRGRAVAAHLIDVHDHLRAELAQVRDLIRQVREGAIGVARARSVINDMTMRQNDWTLGAYCASYCRVVSQHHALEDEAVFPHLRARERGLEPVIDRLANEHKVIHRVLEDVDRALVEFVRHPDDFSRPQEAVDILTDTLLSHLAYEEYQLAEPLARYGFYVGQL